MTERIQNILSHAGVASRRHAAAMIEAGRVAVDGRVVTEPYLRFDPATVKVEVDGRPIAASRERVRTIMLYKPAGVLSTLSDPFGGETVADLLRGPVAMPDGYVTRPVPVEVVRPAGRDNVAVLAFRLREGRKRQIRYMCSAAHLVVLSLKRVAVGALRLPEDLKPGAWRDLTPDERRLLV